MSASSETITSTAGFASLLSCLSDGTTIITPNRRAARVLADRVDQHLAEAGQSSWQAANILPWNAWMAVLWQDAVIRGEETRVLLTEVQERFLWTEIIEGLAHDSLRPAASQAQFCRRATRLLGTYDVRGRYASQPASDVSADVQTFRLWYRNFEDVCAREGYLPSSHLELAVERLISEGRASSATSYLLHGFTDLLPSQRIVMDALRQAGATVIYDDAETRRASTPTLLRCSSPQEELRGCAAWVREQLQASSSCTIAVVVPDLQAVRSDLERELRLAVAPEAADVTCISAVPYEFSIGRRLRTLPIIRDAMLLLRWCTTTLTVDDAGLLLRSPHLSLAETPEAGALLDEDVLRRRAGLQKTMSLRQAASALHASSAGNLLRDLDEEALRYRSRRNTHAYFADHMRTLLEAAGWPGTAPLNPEESDAVERWHALLDQVAALDLLGAATTLVDALNRVEHVLEDALFQPRELRRPVQVMGVEDALSTTADAIWFLRAGAETWPSRHTTDPLLPRLLQRELQMPGTDPERDEDHSRKVLNRLVHVADAIIFSYSSSQDGESARPAALVEQLVGALGGACCDAIFEQPAERVTDLLEVVRDHEPLPALPTQRVAGGIGILLTQAQCGFRAWAEKRAFAKPLEVLEDGLSPRERGDQVHAVLEAFWKQVKDQATLKAQSATVNAQGRSERDEVLQQCIRTVCRKFTAGEWEDAYLHLQEERLFQLLSAWLDFEETRPPFRVLQIETPLQDVPVGPLRLKLRVDRIDCVTTGGSADAAPGCEGMVLIDYKTGEASRNDWLGIRPDQPQLPAYAVAAASAAGLADVSGIAFARVRAGDKYLDLDGMAEPGLLPARHSDRKHVFADQMIAWQAEIESLATAFAAGDAAVDPKRYPGTCATCAQRILCRVNTATLIQQDGAFGEEEEETAC